MTDDEAQNKGWLRAVEQPFYRRAVDFANWCIQEQNWRLTDFLSPRELQILRSVASQQGCAVSVYGGAEPSERVRAYIMPGDWQPESDDFQVSLVTATAAHPMTHGDVLGSILGTGIDRRKVGDIEVSGPVAIVAVCQDIVTFLENHWVQVGRQSISLELSGQQAFTGPQYDVQHVSVASLRLDAIVGACCHWSRTKAKEAVLKGEVSLNFVSTDSADETVTDGDIVSVRHFGRIRIYQPLGESRKGRIRVEVGILKSKP